MAGSGFARRIPWYVHRTLVDLLAARMAGRFDLTESLLITGSPRSGTTWLGQMLCQLPRTTMLFEPLMTDNVRRAREAGFTKRTYKPVDAEWPAGEQFLRDLFEGRIVNPWLLGEFRSMRTAAFARTLLIKSVRANRLLPWMVNHLPIKPPLLILRHPCAVVCSQLAHGAWRNPTQPDAAEFLAAHPRFREVFARVQTPEEILALTWAVDTFVPLASVEAGKILIVSYEELRRDPGGVLAPVFAAWNVPPLRSLGRAAERRSATTVGRTVAPIDGWQQRLDHDCVRRILDVCHQLGLEFYSGDAYPDAASLWDAGLSRRLREGG